MDENKLKHLEFIQNVTTRMNTNSFLLKGWSVTLVAGIFALAAKDANPRYVFIAYFPVVIFWVLDGFYLYQERGFRRLYDAVRAKPPAEIDFGMDPSTEEGDSFAKCTFSGTLISFHGTLLAVVCIAIFVIPKLQ